LESGGAGERPLASFASGAMPARPFTSFVVRPHVDDNDRAGIAETNGISALRPLQTTATRAAAI